jgi:hypothetical protein
MRSGILILLTLGFVGVSYTNCSTFVPSGEFIGMSSLCAAELRAKPVAPFDSASICEPAENYQCNLRIFRPGLEEKNTSEVICVDLDNGRSCVRTTVISFNTERAREGAEPEDFDEGGSYNHEEATCVNTRIKNSNVTVFSGESSNIPEALARAVQSCRKGGA